MILPGLLSAGATFRRVVAARNLALSVAGGVLTGLAVWGLPAPSLATPVFVSLAFALTALLVLPLVAGLPTGDRAGGYESLVGLRPVSSAALALGRVLGSLVGAALLGLLLTLVARSVAAERPVPEVLAGRFVAQTEAGTEWRFPLPAGATGPFDLELDVHLPLAPVASLSLELRRGEALESQDVSVRPARRVTLLVPDLAPARGDLYVTLRPGSGLVLGSAAPQLVVGQTTLGEAGLGLSHALLERLALALLATVAAACAFHFETACLAGLLALLVPSDRSPVSTVTSCALLLVFAVLGTALVRRQNLP